MYVYGENLFVLFIQQNVNMATELCKPVYWTVSLRVIQYDLVLQQMSTVKWDVKEIMSQHNPYIDSLIKVRDDMVNVEWHYPDMIFLVSSGSIKHTTS